MPGVIIVGYIPTAEGEAALDYAIAEAQTHQARVIVVNSSRHDSYVDTHKAGEDMLDAIKGRLEDLGIPHQFSAPRKGVDAASQILDLGDEHPDSMIVIGLRRRSPVGKLLLGSTAQTILSQSTRPVLSVRARDTKNPR